MQYDDGLPKHWYREPVTLVFPPEITPELEFMCEYIAWMFHCTVIWGKHEPLAPCETHEPMGEAREGRWDTVCGVCGVLLEEGSPLANPSSWTQLLPENPS